MRKNSKYLMLSFPLLLVIIVLLVVTGVIPDKETTKSITLLASMFGIPASLLGVLLFFVSDKETK